MGLLRARTLDVDEIRADGRWPTGLSIGSIVEMLFDGNRYQVRPTYSMEGVKTETIGNDFGSYVHDIHRRNGVIAAAVAARSYLVSQLRFEWKETRVDGTTRRFRSDDLRTIDEPRPGFSRATMLSQIERDVSLAGNSFVLNRARLPGDSSGVIVLRPDLVDVVIASSVDSAEASTQLDGFVYGYLYHSAGRNARDAKPTALPADAVAHIMPEPCPLARWRGESWITAIVREVAADQQASKFTDKFFENAATANMLVKAPPMATTPSQFNEWVEAFEHSTTGVGNAWRNLYLGAGADAEVVGSSLGDLALGDLRTQLEARIAARSRVPASLLGAPSTAIQMGGLAQGNYMQVRRSWADTWLAPHADVITSALGSIVDTPHADGDVRLVWDPEDVLFMQEDQRDAAEIMSLNAAAIRQLIDAGFEPDAAVRAIATRHFDELLETHTGLTSVQLLPPDPGGDPT